MLIKKRLKTNSNIIKQLNINKQRFAPWQHLPFRQGFAPFFCKKKSLVDFNIFKKKIARKLDKKKLLPPFFVNDYSKINPFFIAKEQPLPKKKKKGYRGLLLKIVFNSSNSSDIKFCFFLVTKLMNYLNNTCSKNLSSYSLSLGWKRQVWQDPVKLQINNNIFFDTLNLVYLFSCVYLTEPTIKSGLSFLSSEFFYFVEQYNQSGVQKSLLTLQKNNYFNRYFFKWSEQFANTSITKQIHKIQTGVKLFTVIRAPFIFKKTREQFSLKKKSYSIIVKLQHPIQKRFLIQYLGSLRLPAEFEILDLN